MRIDQLQIPGRNDLKVNTSAGAFTDSLKEGDRVTADVLSNDKGAVVLKAEGGQVFRARLDADAELSQGDRILLEYSGREGKLVFLSIMGQEAQTGETSAQALLVRDFDDKSLAPFAGKLAELHMTVTEDASRIMKELTAQNPGMTLEEAAFLASNKLTGDESLIKAALSVLSDGDKADAMLERLINLLRSSEEYASAETALLSSNEAPQSSPLNAQLTAREAAAPLTDWLKLVGEIVTGGNLSDKSPINAAGSAEQGVPVNVQIKPETIIAQSDSDLQFRNVLNNVENQHNEGLFVDKSVEEVKKSTNLPTEAEPDADASAPTGARQLLTPDSQRATPDISTSILTEASGRQGKASALSEQPARAYNNDPEALQPDAEGNLAHSQLSREAGKMIAGLLSDIPEFRGTPSAALERFSDMLLRVAKESVDAQNGSASKLAGLLDDLFTRIDKNNSDAGERLRNAKNELYARLALIEESAARAAPQVRAEMLGQTQKLMDHVRLLNSIDQFVYVQLPVQMGEERKTAELYMFRRKNGKRVDPDNANILLALDLENMGHWEGLINIRKKDVSINMEVRGAGEREYFSEKTVMLHELLSEAGFKLVSTGITCSEEETTPLTALSAFDRFTKGRSGGIDMTV